VKSLNEGVAPNPSPLIQRPHSGTSPLSADADDQTTAQQSSGSHCLLLDHQDPCDDGRWDRRRFP